MTITLHITPTPGSEEIVRSSARAALRDAESMGSVREWSFDDEVTGDGRVTTSTLDEAATRVRNTLADSLESAADLLRR